jgi:deoxyribodipyrimidine photolyase-related protein
MIFIIFPTQLFKNIKHLKNATKIYLIEEPRFFTDFKFHKLKLAYHRATMKKYYDKLKKKFNITYVEYVNVDDDFYKSLGQFTYIDTCDNILNDKLNRILKKNNNINTCKDTRIDTLHFLINPNEFDDIKKIIHNNNKYSHEKFYKYMRVKLDILIIKNTNKPVNDMWSFDTLNREPLPNNVKCPPITFIKSNKYIKEAKEYVMKHFKDNYGSLDNFIYPIDYNSSIKWLMEFLNKRLIHFGLYQDAVSEKDLFLYHSVISPMMNIGLITDIEVVSISNKFYTQHKNKIPIESYEGFIRQVIGWRNYVYLIYRLEGKNMYNSNILNHTNKINNRWWEGTLNIQPIDSIINKIVLYSYAHHIERLMYLGNIMLICMIDPKEVYRIFMEWTIDAYEWVMIPNVFGMSQYASNIMTTRIYFSSSNYILKMSSFKKNEWCDVWNSLYYNFISKHYKLLKKNYATSRQVKHWDNMNKEEQHQLILKANTYMNKYIS